MLDSQGLAEMYSGCTLGGQFVRYTNLFTTMFESRDRGLLYKAGRPVSRHFVTVKMRDLGD